MIITVAVAAIALAIVAAFSDSAAVRWAVWIVAALAAGFTFYFFRDPERTVPKEAAANSCVVLSPGDGKIVQIIETEEHDFFHGAVTRISIFLSPFNVHVNRIPVSGAVTYYKYISGGYIVAFHEKASEKNERAIIGVENGEVKVMFFLIAGFIARRIVCRLNVGDRVAAGERCGMIKFGSRVDVLLPRGAEIHVKVGDSARGGETILGTVRLDS